MPADMGTRFYWALDFLSGTTNFCSPKTKHNDFNSVIVTLWQQWFLQIHELPWTPKSYVFKLFFRLLISLYIFWDKSLLAIGSQSYSNTHCLTLKTTSKHSRPLTFQLLDKMIEKRQGLFMCTTGRSKTIKCVYLLLITYVFTVPLCCTQSVIDKMCTYALFIMICLW